MIVEAMKSIDEAIVANIKKFVIFNGKVAFRISADSNVDDTVVVPETQEGHSHVVQNDFIEDRDCCTETVIENIQTPPDDQQINNLLNIIENFRSSLEGVKKTEDHMIRLINPNIRKQCRHNTRQLLHKFIKNRNSELEKQPGEKNTIIDFLWSKSISKPSGLQI